MLRQKLEKPGVSGLIITVTVLLGFTLADCAYHFLKKRRARKKVEKEALEGNY